MTIPNSIAARSGRLAQGLLAVVLALSAATAGAQAISTRVDDLGHRIFSDRRDAPITHHALPPLPGQTGADEPIRARTANFSAARSRAVDRSEAQRRLRQAEHERARGPDLQQGIPPVAERSPGERRRERVLALQHGVEAAQARVRELDAQGELVRATPPANPKLLSASALR